MTGLRFIISIQITALIVVVIVIVVIVVIIIIVVVIFVDDFVIDIAGFFDERIDVLFYRLIDEPRVDVLVHELYHFVIDIAAVQTFAHFFEQSSQFIRISCGIIAIDNFINLLKSKLYMHTNLPAIRRLRIIERRKARNFRM